MAHQLFVDDKPPVVRLPAFPRSAAPSDVSPSPQAPQVLSELHFGGPSTPPARSSGASASASASPPHTSNAPAAGSSSSTSLHSGPSHKHLLSSFFSGAALRRAKPALSSSASAHQHQHSSSLSSFGSSLFHSSSNRSDLSASTHSTAKASSLSNKQREQPEHAKTLDALGYPQALKREHDAWSLWSVCFCNIGFLQGCLFGSMAALQAGGSSMLSIGWPLGGIFMTIFTASLSELGSAYPFCGAMFTWVWKLCRASPRLRDSARYLSWMTGSLLLCGHVLSQILISFQFAVVLQGTIMIYLPTYVPKTWWTILIAWAELFCIAVVVSYPISRSPLFWKILSTQLLVTALLVIIALVSFRESVISADNIFRDFQNQTGLTSKPYVYLIGWVQTCLAVGQDAAFHLAEETKRPERSVPLACFWSVALTYMLGWVVICVLLGSASTDRFPFRQLQGQFFSPGQILLRNMPKGLAFALLVLLLIVMLGQGVAQLLASSRYAWALGRDKALPFSHWVSTVSPRTDVPYIAVWTVLCFCLPGLLLVAASDDFVETLILAGAAVTNITAYASPCIIYLTLKGSDALEGNWRWTLRGFSKPAAAIGSLYALFVFAVLCMPRGSPITRINLGWAPIMLFIVCVLSTITWVVYGNSHYAGPIKTILGPEIELPRYNALHSHDPAQTPSEAFGRTAQVMATSGASTGRSGYWNTTDMTGDSWGTYETSFRPSSSLSSAEQARGS